MPGTAWISKELVLAIHERQLARHGGLDGLRDEGMLDSALARPMNLAAYADETPSIAQLAAAYAFGLARNHPFLDGNKRTAAVACELFIELNGKRLEATDEDLYPIYIALADGSLSEEDFAAWLESHVADV